MRKLTKIEEANTAALEDAALFHISETMLVKNILDCNAAMRELLKREEVLDYDELSPDTKVFVDGFYSDGSEATISAYRAKGRGDKRIWFKNLKNYADSGDIMALVVQSGKLVIQNVTKGVMLAVLVVSSVGNLPSITS